MLKSILNFGTAPRLVAICRNYAVDKASLSKLRKRTGISFSNCKKALEQFNNDVDQAEKWLIEQAQKEGWAKATKLGERSMSAGLVGLVQDDRSATLLEVNCETDFVAKNSNFHNLVSELTNSCHNHFLNQSNKQAELSRSDLSQVAAGSGTVADVVALTIGNIGENMVARRAKFLSRSDQSQLGCYVHAAGENVKVNNCHLGKFAAVVEVEDTGNATLEAEERTSLTEVASQLAQHIVGLNPKSIGSEEIPTDSSSSSSSSSSDEEETDLEDKTQDFKEEESALLDQDFLMEPEITVREMLQENGVRVNSFLRIECGEELEEDREEREEGKEKIKVDS